MRRATPPTSAATRSFISAAALLVNVIARIENGDASRSAIRYARRCVRTRVLPDPAPAITRTGPTGSVTASRCAGLSPSRSSVMRRRGGASGATSCGSLAGPSGELKRVLAGSIMTPPSYRRPPTPDRTYVRLPALFPSPIADRPVVVLHASRMRCTCSTRQGFGACRDEVAGSRCSRSTAFFPLMVAGTNEGKSWPAIPTHTPNFTGSRGAEVNAGTSRAFRPRPRACRGCS